MQLVAVGFPRLGLGDVHGLIRPLYQGVHVAELLRPHLHDAHAEGDAVILLPHRQFIELPTEALEENGCAENTLILFTSDNGGTHKTNHPLRGKKGMFTEGGVRVPLIAYWPGVIPANTVTDHMVHSLDYYPTYLQLAGSRWTPSPKKHPLDGESFAIFERPRGSLP